MSVAIRELARQPSFRPALRRDLQFRAGARHGAVLVIDPRGDQHQFTDFEYWVAHEMDGRRDVRELTRAVQVKAPLVTLQQIHQLVIKCAELGLLSNVTPPMAPVIPLPVAPPPVATSAARGRPQQPPREFEEEQATVLTDAPFEEGGGFEEMLDDLSDKATEVVVGQDLEDIISSSEPPPRPTPAPPKRVTRTGPIARPTPRPWGPPSRRMQSVNAAVGDPSSSPPAEPSQPTPAQADATPAAPAPAQAEAATPPPAQAPAPAQAEAAPPPAATPQAPAQSPQAPPAQSPAPAAAAAKDPGYEVEKPPWYRRKRPRRLAIAGGVLAALFILSIIPYPLYITEECVVSPVDRAEVRSQISGIIAEVMVREGDKVEIDSPLIRLDDRELVHSLKQAQAERDRFAANLEKVKGGSRPEEIRRAQANVAAKAQDVKFAEIEARRQQKLFNQGVASAMQRDEARRDLGVKRASYSEALAELRLVQSGSRNEEVAVAEAQLRKVEAEIEFLKKQMDNLVVRSPIAGLVLTPRIHERLHSKLEPGDTVAEIGTEESVRVDIFVPESDADVIRVGHPVSVKVKSYPLEEFTGRVSMIAPAVSEIDGERIIRVETVLDNERGLLRPRMSGYAEIDTGNRPLISRILRRAVRWIRVRFLL